MNNTYRVLIGFLFVVTTQLQAQAPELSERLLEERFKQLGLESPAEFEVLQRQLPSLRGPQSGSLPLRLALARLQSSSPYLQQTLNDANRGRIVGGEFARQGELPWQVALVVAGYPAPAGQFCGGSIIAESWVLTAAHCVDNTAPSALTIAVGDVDLGGMKQAVQVAAIHVHPEWSTSTMENDIALLALKSPIPESATAAAITLYNGSSLDGGTLLLASGWGLTQEGGTPSRQLKKVIVPVVPISQCNSSIGYNGVVSSTMLCAGIGGKDSCQGDSGGPLVAKATGSAAQIGIVSWGYGCARPNKPGVYTFIPEFRDWIHSVAGV